MATPADQRMLELMEKWLKSLELHAKYSSLDDDSYWKIQPWMEHQRPSRWIIDLAMQKTIALRTQVEQRMKMGDAQYSDSLELMIFLANLVGSEHIERFIPVATVESERSLERQAPHLARATSDATTTSVAITATATREMPKFVAAKRPPPAAGTATVARTERRSGAAPKPAPKPAVKLTARPPPTKPIGKGGAKSMAAPADRYAAADLARAQVIADAIRLVQWGRKWYELPELIARMADRPSLPEVRRILKENKLGIDARAGGE